MTAHSRHVLCASFLLVLLWCPLNSFQFRSLLRNSFADASLHSHYAQSHSRRISCKMPAELLTKLSHTALAMGCFGCWRPAENPQIIFEVKRTEEPSVLLLVYAADGREVRYFMPLKSMRPRKDGIGHAAGRGNGETMVHIAAKRNETDPRQPGNLLVQLNLDCNGELFVSPLVSWNPHKELMLFHGDNWTVKLVNYSESRSLK